MINDIQPASTGPRSEMTDPQATLRQEFELLRQAQEARLEKHEARLDALEAAMPEDLVSIVVFSGDMDKVLASFVIANGALALGMKVSMYFTFWGLNAIKKTTTMKGKSFKQKMLAVMNPKNSEAMGISKLNMLGMGPSMMRSIMKEKNVASVEDLRDLALEMDTRMIGCSMAMDVMGVDASEFVDGIELGGVATFLDDALRAKTTVFV